MDLGDEHPAVVLSAAISEVVQKLRCNLGNSSDSFKSTTKKLDVVEDNLRFLRLDNLQRVKPHKEEAAAAWLQDLKKAADDAKGLLDDMESEVKSRDSLNPDIMNWISSDDRNVIRTVYITSKLASVCSQGKSFVETPPLNESALEDEKKDKIPLSSVAMTCQNKFLLDDDFLIGRDEEIAMIRDMVLNNAQYEATEKTLEVRQEAENLHIPQKGWITETLQKIDLSKWTQQATEVSPHHKNETSSKVEYIRHSDNRTVTPLRNPSVIPIVGISGVGKSALAKFIFNDGDVQEHFDGRSAWVYMTDKTDLLEMIKKIICSFYPEYALNYFVDLEGACIKFKDMIEGKRFLLVLDDVWDDICVIWNGLRSVLSKGAPGSLVLVTTQLFNVANFVGTVGPVILDPLQDDDSWTLFKSYAFVDPCRSLSTEDLEEIGRKIAHRLPGLPLAVKVIGATLRSKLEEAHWSKLLNSWWWNISNDNFAIRVISSLGSCYSLLPGNLRQCFVYCAIFPRNYMFEKDKLVQMWIANGFVQQNSSTGISRLEDVGGEWFEELVNMGFLQPACKVGHVMHDLVWDFASAMFFNEYHGINKKLACVSQDVRCLSIDMEGLNALPDNFDMKRLRTIMLIGYIVRPNPNENSPALRRIFHDSISLRLLAFYSCSLGAEMGNDMSALKHLRYLDLSFSGIRRLPDSLCSLCQLQVLGLKGCTFDNLPGNMNSLINLRHLHASSHTIAQINGFGKLTKLQYLHEYRVKAKNGHRITELSDMNDLRGSLCISELQRVTDPTEALEAKIVKKDYITALELKWSTYFSEARAPDLPMSILECLSPPRYLQELKLYGYSGFAFPDWVGQLKHVQVVEIGEFKNLQVLPPFGQLEHLKKLKLYRLSSIKDIGSELYGTSNVIFRSLEELIFEHMGNLESWTYAGSNEFVPNLQKLQIRSYRKLGKVPFESLCSATKEITLMGYYSFDDMFYPFDDTFSRYLQGLNGLTRLEVCSSWLAKYKLILPCKQLMSLEYLHIKSFHDVCIKGGLWHIRKLKDLRIIKCSTIVTELDEEPAHEDKQAPTQIDHVMHSLTHLTLGDRLTHIDLENVVPKTPSLRNLRFVGVGSFTSINEKWIQHLTSLQELEFFCCNVLPSSLASLSSLKRFTLTYCHQVHSIPPNTLPGNLKELQIERCSDELEARYQNPTGDAPCPDGCIELWRNRKMYKWRNGKMMYGTRKLIESLESSKGEALHKSAKYGRRDQRMERGHEWPRKQQIDEQSFSKEESPLCVDEQPEEEELQEEWLQPTEGDEYGKGKLTEMHWKTEKEGFPMNQSKESLQSKEKRPLSVDEQSEEEELLAEWLQPSEGEKWPEHEWEIGSWVWRKMEEALNKNEDDPSSLMKEREEWLKEEERKYLHETLGKDWPNISHVPYIRVNEKIVQNLYT